MELPPPDTWQRIRTVLAEVLDRPPQERAAFLNTACADEPAVRREVRALIEAQQDAPAFLEEDVVDFALPLLPDLPPDLVSGTVEGRRVGAYRLLRALGRGGMSTVFLAERTGASFEQQVALKLLPPALRSDALVRRFEQEQQIMASLAHPHIAQLLDGGVTDDGQPYFVMEYVEGRPIDAHCEEHQLSVDERLALFAEVGRAVQHAHRNLVVHRDLKPSNVLITAEGSPKLLDFGVAKLLAEHELPVATLRTRTGARWLTLPYAAPEQVRGAAVTTVTDVYQLGAVLYELLTGRRPFHGEEQQDRRRALEDAILERPPEKPSVIAPEALRGTLRGDLDRIILKALRKEPEHRYSSVEALVEDVERYRSGQPVRARVGTWMYRAKKFVQRHRTGVATTAAVVLLVAGFIAMLMQQQSRTARQRDRAQAEAAKAQQVSSFMVNLFEASNPMAKGKELAAQDLLQRGQQRISQLGEQRAVQAQMLDAMGQAHIGIGNYATADSLLRRALALRRQISDAPRAEIAASLDHWAEAREKRGNYAAAESLAQEALDMRRAVWGKAHPDVAVSLNHVALYKKRQSQYAPAESLYREALSMQRRLEEKPNRAMAATMNNLGQLLTERGDYAAAESLHQETLALRKKLLGKAHPKTAESLNNLALAVEGQGRRAEAESLYRRTLALDRKRLGPEHPSIAIDLNNLAVVLERQGHWAEAESLKRKALAMRRKLLGDDHPDVTSSMNNLAVLLRKKRAYEEAASLFEKVLERLREQFGEEHAYIAFTTGNLADTRLEQGRLAAADSLYRATREMIVSIFGEDHPHAATALDDLGDVREKQHRYAAAARFHQKALAIRRNALGEEHPKTAESLGDWADILMKQDKLKAADSLYREALAVSRKALPANDWRTAWDRSKLGACLVERGRYAAAEPHLKESLNLLRQQRGSSDEYTQTALHRLADLYDAWGKPEEASAWRDSLAAAASGNATVAAN